MAEEFPSGGIYDRAAALGGMFQAVRLVEHAAQHGAIEDETAFRGCLSSLFRFDAPSPAAVFGGVPAISLGLTQLGDYLLRRDSASADATRYYLVLIALERKLARRTDLLSRIRADLEAAAAGVTAPEIPDVMHTDVVARIARCYQETVSTLSPRVMVSGQSDALRDPDNAERIRALLLSALRALILWRQVGGTRLGLLFSRKALAVAVSALLQRIEAADGPGEPGVGEPGTE